MKNGSFVLLVILFVCIVIFTVFIIYQTPVKPISGEPVSEEPKEGGKVDDEIYEEIFVCLIDKTFRCNIWSIDIEKSEITLQLENAVNIDLLIKSFDVSNCESKKSNNIYIDVGGASSINFYCPLEKSKQFEGKITIRYKATDGGPTLTIEGNLRKQFGI